MSDMMIKYGAGFPSELPAKLREFAEGVRPRYMAPMPSQTSKPRPTPDAANEMVSQELRELWLSLRNDCTDQTLSVVKGVIAFCGRVGLLTDVQRELWTLRVGSCPGHADEGGRQWCSYCGDIPSEKQTP